MTTATIELTVDQLFEAVRTLPEEERAALLKRLDESEADQSSQANADLPGFGIWKERDDSAEYAAQLRRETGLRQ
jgi:hypothetical protein